LSAGTAAANTPAFTYSGDELDALAGARNYYDWIADSFAPHLGSRIVEAGAGIGTFTEYLLARRPGARVTVIEPAENNFPHLERRFAGNAAVTPVRGYLDDTFTPAAADSVVAVNVMEHVPDDAAFLRAATRALVPGGHVLLFVPALPALFGSLDRAFEHYRRYTRSGIERSLVHNGFEIEKLDYLNLLGVAAWFVSGRVLHRTTLGRKQVRFYDRWVIPVLRRIESVIPIPIGQSLLVIGRKPST
jgi:SAM-dependent methyltransferase